MSRLEGKAIASFVYLRSELGDLAVYWVCNAPFDESKPVKLLPKKEEEISIEQENLRKTKN